MLRRCSLLSLSCLLLLWAACSTPRRGDAPLRTPAPAQKSAPAPVEPGTKSKLAPGDYAVLIDSEPAGGIVVVNGVPSPLQPVPMVQNRWQGYLSVPPGTNSVHYRFKFDYLYNNIGTAPKPDSAYSPEYRLKIISP